MDGVGAVFPLPEGILKELHLANTDVLEPVTSSRLMKSGECRPDDSGLAEV